MDIKINKARPQDAEDMMAVRLVASFGAYVDDKHGITEEDMIVQYGPEAVDTLKQNLSSNKTRGWVVLDQKSNELIGASTARPKKDYILFWTIHLLPEYQGKGVGRLILKEMLKWAEEMPQKTIVCYVVDFNTARIEWYKRLGFKETGSKDWVLKTGKVLPRIKMVKEL